IAISRSGDAAAALLNFFNNLNQVVLKMIMILVHFAPYGIFCLLAKLFAETGVSIFGDLAVYFLTVLGVLLVQCLLVYPSILKAFTRLSPIIFLRKMYPVMVFGFSTASSNATLPVTMRTVES